MSPVKPMLAAEADLSILRYPLYATPKLDGVRAMVTKDGVFSRTWKLIPNKLVQAFAKNKAAWGLDGELIVGDPCAPDVYRTTQSVTARADDPTQATFYAFDRFDMPESDYYSRRGELLEDFAFGYPKPYMNLVSAVLCTGHAELLEAEAHFLERGYEGLILRSPHSLYKHGRSTAKEQGMLKLKRFVDSEAEIIGMEEEMHNGNEAKDDAFGRTERSSHKENLTGKGRMGALIVRDVKTGVEFKIGTGFTAEEREWFWRNAGPADGPYMVVKYKSFLIGVKDKPRFPSYLGLREGWDHDNKEAA